MSALRAVACYHDAKEYWQMRKASSLHFFLLERRCYGYQLLNKESYLESDTRAYLQKA